MYRYKRQIFHIIWLFALCSMTGFLLESLESWVRLGYVENRQTLLYGPFTPIYGGGALVFALLYHWLGHRHWLPVFVTTAVSGTVVEYLWAWTVERWFGTAWWSYDHMFLEWEGRISLLFTIIWGVLGLLFIKIIYPHFCRIFAQMPTGGVGLVSLALVIVLSGNFMWSALVFQRYAQRQQAVPAGNQVALFVDEVYPDQRLQEQFPTMRLVGESTSIDNLTESD